MYSNDSGATEKYFWAVLLLIFSLIVSYPLISTDNFIAGHDWLFSFMRIEGMKNCILGGQFPVRISGYMFNDYGELSGIFYPNLFIYVPVLLRLCGISWITSYNIFCVMINVVTAVLSYCSFSHLFKSYRQGAVAAMLYTGFFYRLVDLYSRGAIGEVLAMTFLPLTFIGLWLTLHRSSNYWSAVVIGFTGILQSHILSSLMMLFAAVVIIIFSFNRFIQNLKSFAKIIFFTTILNLWFYLPFLDFYSQIPFRMKFSGFQEGVHALSNSVFDSAFFLEIQAFCGFITPIIIFIAIISWYKNKYELNQQNFSIDNRFFIMLLVGLICVSLPFSKFLCYAIEAIPYIGEHIGIIQFAFRFMIFGSFALSYCLTVSLVQISNFFKRSAAFLFICATLLSLSNVVYLTYMPNYTWSIKPCSDTSWVNMMKNYYKLSFDSNIFYQRYFKFGYFDYIYNDVKPEDVCFVDNADWIEWDKYFDKETKIPFDDIRPANFVSNFNKVGTTITFTANVEGNATFTLPLFYYPGYEAVLSDGTSLKIHEDEKHRLMVDIPVGENSVTIKYIGNFLWNIVDIVSIFGPILLVLQIYRERNNYSEL